MSAPLERSLSEGDHVIIDVPHLGLVSGNVKAVTHGEYVAVPQVCVQWLTGGLDLIEVARLERNGHHGWYVKPQN